MTSERQTNESQIPAAAQAEQPLQQARPAASSPIEILGLPTRIRRSLKRSQIRTVTDLQSYLDDEWRIAVRGIGEQSTHIIEEVLDTFYSGRIDHTALDNPDSPPLDPEVALRVKRDEYRRQWYQQKKATDPEWVERQREYRLQYKRAGRPGRWFWRRSG